MLSGRCPKVLLKLSLAHWGEQERRGGGVGGDGGRGVRWSQHRHDEVVLQHRVAEGAASPMRLRGDPPSLSTPRAATLFASQLMSNQFENSCRRKHIDLTSFSSK